VNESPDAFALGDLSEILCSRAAEPKIPKELLDQLVTHPITRGEFDSIFRALKKAVSERAMSAEMNEHLGY
jgi:putative transposase